MTAAATLTLLLLLLAVVWVEEASCVVHGLWYEVGMDTGENVGEAFGKQSVYKEVKKDELLAKKDLIVEEYLWEKMKDWKGEEVLQLAPPDTDRKLPLARHRAWQVSVFGIQAKDIGWILHFTVRKELMNATESSKPFYISPTSIVELTANNQVYALKKEIDAIKKFVEENGPAELAKLEADFANQNGRGLLDNEEIEQKEREIAEKNQEIANAAAGIAEKEAGLKPLVEELDRAHAATFDAVKKHLCAGVEIPPGAECCLHHGADELRSMADLRKLPIRSSVTATIGGGGGA